MVVIAAGAGAEVEVLEPLSQERPRFLCSWSVCRQWPVVDCSPLFSAQAASSCDHHPVTNVPGLWSAWCAVAAVFDPPAASSLCVNVPPSVRLSRNWEL